jgi:hypothetical protein
MNFNFDKPIRSAPMVLAVAVALGALVVLVQPSRIASASTARVSHAGHLADAEPGDVVGDGSLDVAAEVSAEVSTEVSTEASTDVETGSRDADQVGVEQDEP